MDASKLTERLRGIVKPSSPSVVASGPPLASGSPVANVASGFGRTSPLDPTPSLQRALGGEWREGGRARCFVVERRVSAEAFHGDVRVDECATRIERSMTRASLLMRNGPAQSPFMFFDLETTGLSGGAGTYAFLVGCGWFAGDGSFVTRQYFLAEYGGERSMLEAVTGDFERAGVLVSFNGKSFDAPLLETRYVFHRLGWLGGEVPHLDLLHPARRFWGGGGHESSCSLGALERKLARVHRQNDVAGFEIPARYFQFLRSGDARPLSGVLEHNRQDLLSLAVLTACLLQLVEDGSGATIDAREALALGHVYADSGLDWRAREAYRRAVALSMIDASTLSSSDTSMVSSRDASIASSSDTSMVSLGINALRALAIAERRALAYDDAAACWQRLLDLPGCPPRVAGEALEALAVHHEHRLRDLATARVFALRSLKQESRPSWTDAVRHRLARLEKKLENKLEKKLERLTEPPLFPSSPSQPQLSCGSPMSARRTSL